MHTVLGVGEGHGQLGQTGALAQRRAPQPLQEGCGQARRAGSGQLGTPERTSMDHISLSGQVQGQGLSRPSPGRKWPGGEQDNCSETQSGIRAKGVSGVSLTAQWLSFEQINMTLGSRGPEPRAPRVSFSESGHRLHIR